MYSRNLSNNSKDALNLKLNSLKIMNNMGKMISISELVSIKTNYKRANNNIKKSKSNNKCNS